MGFYYAREQRKFKQAWDEMKKKYIDAGMDEAAIKKIREFDWQWFCSQRSYENHTQSLPEPITTEMSDEESTTPS